MSRSSGSRDVGAAETTDRAAVTTRLLRQGVSPLGAHQLLMGEPIASPGDRALLAQILSKQLGFTIEQPVAAIGMLIPAVQVARTPPTKPDQRAAVGISRLGVSSFGARQFLTGLPVTQPDDRKRLAQIVAAAASGASATMPA